MFFFADQFEGEWRPLGAGFGRHLAFCSSVEGLLLVVGERGQILTSRDGAQTFHVEPSFTHEDLFGAAAAAGAAYALAKRGLLVSLEAGQWRRASLPLERDAVAVAADDRGVYVLDGSTVFIGDPAGERWVSLPTGHEGMTSLLVALDGALVVLGAGGVILRSSGGAPFKRCKNPSKAAIHAACVGDDGTLWAVGARGLLLRSRGGAPWERVAAPTRVDLQAVRAGGGFLLVAGDRQILLSSADGGGSFSDLAPPVQALLRWFGITAFCGLPGGRLLALCGEIIELKSGEATRLLQASGWPTRLFRMPSGQLWTMGSQRCVRLDDERWQVVRGIDSTLGLHGCVSVSASPAGEVAVGGSSAISFSDDSGESWRTQALGTHKIFALAHGTEGELFAVEWPARSGVACTLHRRDASGQLSQTQRELDWPSCCWPAPGELWLVDHAGTLLLSRDGGATFEPVSWPKDRADPAGEYWAGRLTASCCGGGVVLVACTHGWMLRAEGGPPFELLSLPSRGYVNSIAFLPGGEVVLSARGGVMLSRDRGRSFVHAPLGEGIDVLDAQRLPSGRWLALAQYKS